ALVRDLERQDVEALDGERLRLGGREGPLPLQALRSDREEGRRHEARQEVPTRHPWLPRQEQVGTGVGTVRGAEDREGLHWVPVQVAEEDRPRDRVRSQQVREAP